MIYDQFGYPAPPTRPRQIGFVPPPAQPREEQSKPETDAIASSAIYPEEEVPEL